MKVPGSIVPVGWLGEREEPPPFLGALPGFPQAAPHYSEDTTHKIDDAVRTIIQKAFARASAILKERRDTLEAAAKLLLERETLDESALAPLARLMSEGSALQEKSAAA